MYSYLALLLLLWGVASQNGVLRPPAQPSVNGSIAGTIRSSETGVPLPDMSLIARGHPTAVRGSEAANPDRTTQVTAAANADGHYELNNLPPGRYLILAFSKDRLSRINGTRVITLRAGEHLKSIDFALRPTGFIAGKVFDERNEEPLPGITVYLISKEYYFGALGYVVRMATTTNDRGEYRLSGVRPEESYIIMAQRRDWPMRAISDVPADPKKRQSVLATTFYPNSDVVEGAQSVVLRPGEHRESVDIPMLHSHCYCARAILEARGQPAALQFSIIEEFLSIGDSWRPGGMSGPDGTIRLCGLQPGRYRLTASERSPTPSGDLPFFGETSVSIVDYDLEDIQVQAQAPMSLRGQVMWDRPPRNELGDNELWVTLQPLTRAYRMEDDLKVKPSIPGQFSFSGVLNGDYTIATGGRFSAGVYIKDIRYAGIAVKNAPFHIGSAIGNADLQILVGHDGGALTVKTTDNTENPVPASSVFIIPADVTSQAELAEAAISGETDQDGSYSNQNLAPGKYYVVATTTALEMSFEGIDKLWRARFSKAKDVEISAGNTVEVTLHPADLN